MKGFYLSVLLVLVGIAATAQTVTFSYTGGLQSYTVPAGTTQLSVDMTGGQGGSVSGYGVGGNGGRVQGTISVTPLSTIYIYVGQGLGAVAASSGISQTGGTNSGGGGQGGNSVTSWTGAGGGGSTDIRTTSGSTAAALNSRILVAGGGGGGSYDCGASNGGAGGGTTGGAGTSTCGTPTSIYAGQGGTPTAGGAKATGSAGGTAGALGVGGNGVTSGYAGGGGGGHYGGGGGYQGSGGGGSSYSGHASVVSATHTQGYQTGNGYVTITPLVSCSGTPSAGTISSSTSAQCTAYSTTLSLSGATVALGIVYQWQSSTDNASWAPIAAATNASYSTTVSSSIYYRCAVTCTTSSVTVYTPSQLMNLATCYYMPTSGVLSANVCNGVLYDNGGPGANYSDGINGTYTFYPGTPGKKVSLAFTSFAVEGDPYDYMDIYNGNSTSAPAIGHYTSSPGTVTSTATDGSITVRFIADGIFNYAGFIANISLTGTATNPITAQPAVTSTMCLGGTPAALSVTTTGTLTYQWFDNGTTNSNVGGSAIASANGSSYTPVASATGTKYYYVVVSDPCGVSTASNTAAVIVNPTPSAITGSASAVCQGRTITLGHSFVTGTWSSSNGTIASVTGAAGTATVTGGTAGVATISYATATGPGCYVSRSITTNAAPAAIAGTAFQTCELGNITLTHPDGGTGTWSSASPSVAGVGISSGIVSGLSSGYATISYTNTNGCVITRQVTVNQLPLVSVAPATSATICLDGSRTFTATSADPQISLMSQDFNSGLAGWTVNSTSGLAASHWQIVPPPGLAGFNGDGTNYLQAASSASASPNPPTITTITSTAFSTQGAFASATLSFNQYLLSFAPPDAAASIEYSINGGTTWTLIQNQVGSLVSDAGDNGDWVASVPEYTVAMPAAAMGQSDVRIRFVYNAQSLHWLIDNIKVKGVMPASSFAWTGAAGLSCTNCAAPVITPTLTGTNSYNLAVTSSAGCVTNTAVTVSVNANPTPISGNLNVCDNGTSTLSSAPAGTWLACDPAKASITSGTGVLSGHVVGTTCITYTASSTGCTATAIATVLPSPAALSPASVSVCLQSNVSVSSATAGGAWSTSNPSVAGLTSAGSSTTVTGMGVGVANVSYTMPNSCYAARAITVNALPADITGANAVCQGASTAFSNTDAFGTWTSNNAMIASVNSASGLVTGVAPGNTTITYTMPGGCYKVKSILVNAAPQATVGESSMCVNTTTALFNPTGGGVWSSSAPSIVSVNTSGVVTSGSFAGSADINYALTTTGCSVAHTIAVNPLPQNIGGPTRVCKDATVTFTNADLFGTWSSDDATIASVGGSGVVTGTGIGATRIIYTLPTGCATSKAITVNALPNDIVGNSAVCYGSTANLVNTTPLGTWSSSNMPVATISSIGQVTPVAAMGGTTTITYMVTASGCYKTKDITVNMLPDAITGTTTMCHEATSTLASTSPSGIWTSGNSAVFAINPASGAGTAMSAGNANVTYTLPTGCRTSTGVAVNPNPQDIYGNFDVCAGRQTTMATLSTGGNWSSSNTSVAAVNSSGVLTGNSSVTTASTAMISYTFTTGCYTAEQVTVNPLPGAITGNFAICAGSTSDLSSADGGGTWASSNNTVAPISLLGTVSANNAGGAMITYTLPTGCLRTQAVVVNPLPAAITGTASVCEGLTTDLNNATAGGTWSSETMAVGTVDASTGLVTGIDDGTTNIVYTLPTGCARSRAVVVNVTPDPIGGTLSACLGQTSQLTGNPVNGTWSTSSSSVAGVNVLGTVTANGAGAANVTYTLPGGCRTMSAFVSNPLPGSINGTRVICKDGTSMLANATPNGVWSSGNSFTAAIDGGSGEVTGNSAGVTSVTYTLLSTGCARSANVTVNALPSAITGNAAVCVGSATNLSTMSTGGAWSSSNPTVASVSNAGVVTGNNAGNADIAYTFSTGCRTALTVTVNALPANITGASSVCFGQQATVYNGAGGTWTVENPAIANVDASGVITGLSVGTTDIKYADNITGCFRTKAITVNAVPAAIMGNMSVCQGATTMLTNSTPNGTWSSSNTGIASVNSGSGVASGLAVGFSIMQYTLPTGCSSNATLVVNPLPDVITGTPSMCVGGTAQLDNNTGGGTWSSSNAVASVNASGLVTGVAVGTAIITYTTGNGCRRIRVVTSNALPATISGSSSVCPGVTTTLSNSVTGGSWSSDDMAIATITNTGAVSAATNTGGTANIVYTLPTGCLRSKQITVNPAVDAITGDGTVCKNSDITLSNTMMGGAWSSSNTAVATVNTTGTVTGAGAGVVDIAYTMPSGCKATKQVVVNTLPGNISGAASVCNGSTVNLGNSIAGGSWTSSNIATATVTGPGAVTGVAAGLVNITYSLPTGCMTVRSMAVNNLPAVKNVTGGGAYCQNGAGVAVGVDGSEPGMLYKLMAGGSVPVLTITGGGGVVNFGNQTGAGTYIVTAVSPEGCMQNMDGNAVITINSLITPTVTLASDKGTTVCAGTPVAYMATGANGGSAPTTTWMVNGVDMSSVAAYTYAPENGDVVSVRYTSSEACASPASVTAQMTMNVRDNLTPAVTISANPGNKLCAGQNATYTAAIVNGGGAPTYAWMVDGAAVVGATNATYSYVPDNGDLVVCKLTSSYSCVSTNGVSSNGVTMEMAPVYIPVVAVNAAPGTVVPRGTEVTYTATVSNAGPTPTYQWLVNMEEIAGANSTVFKTSKLKDGDSVTCRVSGTGECSKTSINSVVMTITTSATGVATNVMGNSEIRLMPNPNSGVFTVSGTLATATNEAVSFEVTNMLGQVVYKGNTTAKAGAVEAKIDLGNNLANGMYMLNMTVGTERKAFHFVVKQ